LRSSLQRFLNQLKRKHVAGSKQRPKKIVRKFIYESQVRGKTEDRAEAEEPQGEDVEKAIEHLKIAAKYVLCPFCRAQVVHLIEYFYTYHFKTLLHEAGVEPSKVDEVFEERYASLVREKVKKIKEELNVTDFYMKETAKEFARSLMT